MPKIGCIGIDVGGTKTRVDLFSEMARGDIPRDTLV